MIYNIIFIFFITVIIAYLFGITLVNLIDNRLDKIKINVEKFDNKDNKDGNFANAINNNPVKTLNTNFDNDYYKQMEKDAMVKGNLKNDDNFKEWKIEEKKTQTCIKNHIHEKKGHHMNCTYGLTNYSDPNDLSLVDYKIFKLNYPKNMTLQDYINWLYCYIDKENELPYNHLKNLEKLKLGKELIEEHGILPPPGYYHQPLQAKDYFDKLYNETNEFQIAQALNSTTGPMIGYNYDEYSEFSQNYGAYGDSGSIRNTDIGLKKNSKKLNNYINPKDSNSINIDKENEIYRIKNVEL
jgi:hypothetical protein